MKNLFVITFAATLMSGYAAHSQTVPVAGRVADEKGRAIPYAFVRDSQHNYATYADSTGFFTLHADPSSSLEVMAYNYRNASVKVDGKTSVNVISLKPLNSQGNVVDGIVPLNANEPIKVAGSTFLQERQLLAVFNPTYAGGVGGGGGGGTDVTVIKEGYTVEPTRGSRYLYDNWVPGLGISKKDSLIVETANLYNYDKMNGNIMYTNDGISMAAVSTQQVKTFSLYDKSGHAHIYEDAPLVSNKPFVEVLLSTPKYKIYKKVDTKLKRADFHTDGVLENGHRYDEYIDDERYYFVGANDSKAQSISLKKSTLKKLLSGDADGFIASQGSRDVDEDYVRDLGSSLTK